MRTMLDQVSKRLFLILTMLFFSVVVFAGNAHAADFSLEEISTKYGVWIGLVFLIVEYILGKTTLVKSGSTLELVINTAISLLKKVFGTSSGQLK